MGRPKPVPKRRRIDEEAEAQTKAIETLRAASQEDVENAAVHVIRSGLPKWKKYDYGRPREDGTDPSENKVPSSEMIPQQLRTPPEAAFEGLDVVTTVQDFAVFEELHDVIKSRASTWTSWSGALTDPRKRAFGFLPQSLGFHAHVRRKLDISMPDTTDADASRERRQNERAMVILSEHDIPPHFTTALEKLLSGLRSRSSSSEHVQKYLRMDQLVAAQPNLHAGRHLLPAHVDHPTKDGFGVIIVTIAIRGDATIMLETANRKHQLAVELPQKSAYMLSNKVRNACTHAVLADETSGQRESLNLRFGLHGRTFDDPPEEEVLKYWHDGKL
mmetsp:Transcript_16782/g.20140  ORF Transcript_16782/g.20140 Transcript_16782/m.20140 type:complete len:331 (-) Transcript_16782:18-1010(-)